MVWVRFRHTSDFSRFDPLTFCSDVRSFFLDLIDGYGHSLDNSAHIWLGVMLFLPDINADLLFFQAQHNEHPLRTEHGRSPRQTLFMGMLTSGVCGIWPHDQLEGPMAWAGEDMVDELYAAGGDADEYEEDTRAAMDADARAYVPLEDPRCPFHTQPSTTI